MTLDRSSKAVRYYVFLLKSAGNEDYAIEARLSGVKDLCQFVRAIILRTIGLLVTVAFFLIGLTVVGLIAYQEPVGVALFIVGLASAIGALFLIAHLIDKARERRKDKPDGVVLAYVKAVKRGICPLLTISPR